MKVLLAGYNIDTDVIKDLLKNSPPRLDVTPETLSASYARISRDPRPINELRQISRKEVEKARKSNKAIIFNMGHHSVAEHAVFNFDIIGISRLAIEEIEHFRLCSYTEKSQRYIMLGNDFIIPEGIKDAELEGVFLETVKLQNGFYNKAYRQLRKHFAEKYPVLSDNPKQLRLIEGMAKEDARYITSLATQGQLGQTINARNMELLLRRFASHRLAEVRELGRRLYALIESVAPSIILFYKADDYDKKTYPALKQAVDKLINSENLSEIYDVSLENYTPDADNITLAVLMHTSSMLSFSNCLERVKKLKAEEKENLIKTACRYMQFYDSVPREFEYVSLTYNMVISASCFAQFKRHRMASMTTQAYNPQLGVTIPESIIETGMEREFTEVIKKTEDAYSKIEKKLPDAAAYILTNAHRRRILLRCNARELYHISRLREDKHAQWDIRDKAKKMAGLAYRVMPLTAMLIGGKDNYSDIYEKVYGRLPVAIAPKVL